MSRVEAGNRLSLVFTSWLGMTAALNWISRVEGASRVVAGNGLGVVCAIWLATAAVDMAADVDIVGRIEFRGGGIVNGMDNAVVDWHG